MSFAVSSTELTFPIKKMANGRSISVPGRKIAGLDGLRAVAILAVFASHLPVEGLPKVFNLGWIGVDLFFVISGFLITDILITQVNSAKFLGVFYGRRFLRIWPAYFALLGFVYWVGPRIHPFFLQFITYPAGYFVLFVQNLLLDLHDTGPLAVTWSLAIEEQFYIVWPVLTIAFPRDILRRITVMVFILSPIVRWMLIHRAGVDPWALYFNTATRLDGLAAGCFIALWIKGRFGLRWMTLAMITGALGFLGCLLATEWQLQQSPWSYSFLALFWGVVVMKVVTAPPDKWYQRVLNIGWLRYTGRISYGLYLIHVFVLVPFTTRTVRNLFLGQGNPIVGNLAMVIAMLLLTFLLASASWFFMERPILSFKRYLKYGKS